MKYVLYDHIIIYHLSEKKAPLAPESRPAIRIRFNIISYSAMRYCKMNEYFLKQFYY